MATRERDSLVQLIPFSPLLHSSTGLPRDLRHPLQCQSITRLASTCHEFKPGSITGIARQESDIRTIEFLMFIMVSHQLLPYAFSELFAQASTTRKLTLADRYGILAALCDNSMTSDEMQALDRLFYAIRKGYVQVVNDLSTVV
ncbi:hypothetical protein OsccyDRAFT_2403 [Leptolyngbyaceae cyanobacterium JSC-12]|nr:hypothetical protein OsccyDRAFT_2403 [Leptolyngbyaceae cyanobacterium JSC-12]